MLGLMLVLMHLAAQGQTKPLQTCESSKCIAVSSGPMVIGEPMDVPAVEEERSYKVGVSSCKSIPNCNAPCVFMECKEELDTEKVTTCADKRRVLLVSEDGKKHCVLFGE